MSFKNILDQLNFVKQCRRYNLGLWQCPSFLTLMMGLVTIAAMLGTYFIASRFTEEPAIVALIVLITTAIIFIIGYLIVINFNRLAEVNRMKSEFVSIVSHQLRTPLSSLKWSLNLLMGGKLDKIDIKQKEYLKIIEESNERMIKLVNDLLDVSRIEQGRLDLKPERVSLPNLIKDLISEMTPLAQANNVLIELEIDDNLPDVFADSARLRLAIGNLIDNAIRYIKEKGKVKIKLTKKNNQVKCQIEDNGVGIPDYQKNQVFQKFFRSENIMKYQIKGTGLGLFIAKAIIEASGGKIGFTSQEGVGSTFWVILPIAKPKSQTK